MKGVKIFSLLLVFGYSCCFTFAFANPNHFEKNHLICNLKLGKLSASQIMHAFNNQFHQNRAFKILFGDGEWVIKTVGKNNFIKLYLDPNSGRITGRKVYFSQNAFDYAHTAVWSNKMLPLSNIIHLLEQAGYANIEFVQWTGNHYMAHVCYQHQWDNIRIDAYSGNLVRINASQSLEIQ